MKRPDLIGNKFGEKHGHTWTDPVTGNARVSPTYASWRTMKHACRKPAKSVAYKDISYCERWACFSDFLIDMGERPEGTQLTRRDVTKDFDKSNCFWGAPSERIRGSQEMWQLSMQSKNPFDRDARRRAGSF